MSARMTSPASIRRTRPWPYVVLALLLASLALAGAAAYRHHRQALETRREAQMVAALAAAAAEARRQAPPPPAPVTAAPPELAAPTSAAEPAASAIVASPPTPPAAPAEPSPRVSPPPAEPETGWLEVTAESALANDPFFQRLEIRIRIFSNDWKTVALPYREGGLPPGPCVVDLAAGPYQPLEAPRAPVTLYAGLTTAVHFVMSPLPAQMLITCNVSNAVVWDGAQALARVGERFALPPFRAHQVVLTAEDYSAVTQALAPADPGAAPPPVHVELPPLPGPQVGRDWTVPGVGMAMVWIATQGWWAGKFEVANEEFRRFRPGHDSGSYQDRPLNGARQPASGISYDDAAEFADWLTQREAAAGRLPVGWAYRLPGGEEWTALAECGDLRDYPWGDTWPPPPDWNYHSQAAVDAEGRIRAHDDQRASCPVEQNGTNDWGLCGIGGNVWEWTSETQGTARVLRGASWLYYDREDLRVDARLANHPSLRYRDFGFRLLLAPAE